MADSLQATYRRLLDSFAFAARAHQHCLRKDGRTPYVSHSVRVAFIVRHVFGIDDPAVVSAAVLHDTLEDTPTDFDDLEKEFGRQVAEWVATLSKDTRLPCEAREAAYRDALSRAPWQVKVCKLADIFDNLMDCVTAEPKHRKRTIQHSRLYLKALLQHDLPEQVRRPWELVDRLVGELDDETPTSGEPPASV
ncbi:MAG: HD domain-containing protein [Gemmataceae bacterium]|nr:HD domain-containing protein [Gemmataceae bacterium]MDW8264149.1 HD domain-containing protein [Gemmataceae bacterium]